MDINEYHFVTRWLVPGTPREVSDVLGNPAELPRWWPSVYLEAEELDPGQSDGSGRAVRLRTRGWLPYTLDWTLTVTESRDPHGFTFDAQGDFEGVGDWSFESAGAWVGVSFDWRIEARKPLLRLLAPVLRPVLEANHRWAMRRGEESLKLELERRRAASEWEKERVPTPPGPATRSGWILLGAGAGVLALLAAAESRRAVAGGAAAGGSVSGDREAPVNWAVQLTVLGEVAVAMVLGAMLGLDRELAKKPAGLRTHMLVAGAAALLVGLVDVLLRRFLVPPISPLVRADPVPVITAVVMAVGFLGAGSIIRHEDHVEGLTTAASLLFAAAIGATVGLEQFPLAAGVTLLALATLKGLRAVEEKLRARRASRAPQD